MASLAMNARRDMDRRNGSEDHPGDRRRRLRGRNIAVAAALGVLVVLFYIVAIVKMSGG